MEQAGFFDALSEGGPKGEAAERAGADRQLVVTNRSNLIDFLSSSLLRPKEALGKYYDDSLALGEGAIPVLVARAPANLVSLSSEELANFAVLVELDPTVVRRTADPAFGYVEVETVESILAVHVRTAEDLEELTAREFDNVDYGKVEFRVSPALFDGPNVDGESITSAITATRGKVSTKNFALIDRIGGGRLLALNAAPRNVEAVELLLDVAFGKPRNRGRKKAAGLADWLRIDTKLAEYNPVKSALYDERIFLAAASVCLARSPYDAWDGAALLGAIDAVLARDQDFAGEDAERWNKARERIQAVLSAVAPFQGFDRSGFSSEKALLLALVRGGAEEVLAWRAEPIGADEWDLVVAALLVGLARGRTLAPIRVRPRALDRVLARAERDALVGVEARVPVWSVETRNRDGERVLAVALDGDEGLWLRLDPPSSAQALAALDLADERVKEALVELAESLGWNDALVTYVSFEGGFEHVLAENRSSIKLRGRPSITSELDLPVFRRHVESDQSEELRGRLDALAGMRPYAVESQDRG